MAEDDRTEELRLLRDVARWTREAALPAMSSAGKISTAAPSWRAAWGMP